MVNFTFTITSKDGEWTFHVKQMSKFFGTGTEIKPPGETRTRDINGESEDVDILMLNKSKKECYRIILDNTTVIVHGIIGWDGEYTAEGDPVIDASATCECVVTSHLFEGTDDPEKIQKFEHTQNNEQGEFQYSFSFAILGPLKLIEPRIQPQEQQQQEVCV